MGIYQAEQGGSKKGKEKAMRKERDGESKQEEEGEEKTRTEWQLEFIEKVKKLSNEGLTKMVAKVQELAPPSIHGLEDDKIQIQLDEIGKEAFAVVSEAVDEILQGEMPSKRVKTQ
mmetsp:Transcript_28400/g.21211  ORF Transcript_28400/g.21211 Transcript_28400/m.21211 type:complete len:116 (+) Transcript_28400:255-602(+)